MSDDVHAFPIRLRGYDRDAVDWELHELRTALDHAQAERDRAVARALAVESSDRTGAPASATVQWLIDTAEQDAQRIRDEAKQAASECTERADELLRHRVDLIDQAQREADVCRAKASEEARRVIREALEKADAMLHGLQESEEALRKMFESGALIHRMPPPRGTVEDLKPNTAGTTHPPAAGNTDDGPQIAAQRLPAEPGGQQPSTPAAGTLLPQARTVQPPSPADPVEETVASQEASNTAS